jgi:hypothetical protein
VSLTKKDTFCVSKQKHKKSNIYGLQKDKTNQ